METLVNAKREKKESVALDTTESGRPDKGREGTEHLARDRPVRWRLDTLRT